jgi:hypothetical protein
MLLLDNHTYLQNAVSPTVWFVSMLHAVQAPTGILQPGVHWKKCSWLFFFAPDLNPGQGNIISFLAVIETG